MQCHENGISHAVSRIETDLYGVYNASFSEFAINQQFNEVTVSNVQVTMDKIDLEGNVGDVNVWMNAILTQYIGEFNEIYADGFDLATIVPTIAFVNGLMMKTLLTPLVLDANLFGGFRWLTDF